MSTAKQGEGASLDAQRDAIMAFASRENLSVIRWFEEKETAAKRGRPVFNQMLRLLKRGAARGLIIHKIDRSARNLRDWSVVTELPDFGIDVFIATETLDFRSRGGRLTADIQAVIAADYIRNLREETIKGLNGRLKQGLYPFRAPIGYLDNGRGKPKTPDPVKAPLVRKLFELYASGAHGQRSLQAEMARQGLKNNAGKAVSLTGICTILDNPFYTGIIEIKRTGKVWKGAHEPLISAQLFKNAQDQKAGRAGKKVTKHNHLFRGLFRCGLCGGPMVPERQKGHVYYRCHDNVCPTKTLREDRLNQQVRIALAELQLSEEQTEQMAALWKARLDEDASKGVLRGLQLRISENQARTSRLTDLLIDGAIDTGEFDQRKKSLVLELASLEQQYAAQRRDHTTPEEIDGFLARMSALRKLYDAANDDEKRRLLFQIFDERSIEAQHIRLVPNSWVRTNRAESEQVPSRTVIEAAVQTIPRLQAASFTELSPDC